MNTGSWQLSCCKVGWVRTEGGKSRVRGLGVARPWGETVVGSGARTQESLPGPDRPHPQTGKPRCSEHKQGRSGCPPPWGFGDPVPSPPPGLPTVLQFKDPRRPLVVTAVTTAQAAILLPSGQATSQGRGVGGCREATPEMLPSSWHKDSQPPTRRAAFRFCSLVCGRPPCARPL